MNMQEYHSQLCMQGIKIHQSGKLPNVITKAHTHERPLCAPLSYSSHFEEQ
jgi:hypothetical protein